ncbi:hypothetical protein L0156_05985 [bacterium]|nr:hypothetical protein [bacterium]
MFKRVLLVIFVCSWFSGYICAQVAIETVADDRNWIAPNRRSTDLLNMFSGSCSATSNPSPDGWIGARNQTNVFLFFRETVDNLNACCNSNTLQNFRAKKAFCWLQNKGIKIAIASSAIVGGPVDPDCTATANAANARTAIRNIQSGTSGGTVTYVDLDEPWLKANRIGNPPCYTSMDPAAEVVKNFIDNVHSEFPSVKIGLTEPHPRIPATELMTWMDVLKNHGVVLPFFHLDVNMVEVGSNTAALRSAIQTLNNYCQANGIVFGVIFIGASGMGNDCEFYDTAIPLLTNTKAAIGRPQHSLFMSFGENDPHPNNLTECNSCSMTRLENDGLSLLQNDVKKSTFVSQSNIPTSMGKGQTVSGVKVTMKNTGTTTWQTPSRDGSSYFLTYFPTTVNPPCSAGGGWVQLPGVGVPSGSCVPPGQTITFNFAITSPLIAGTYQFRWRMMREDAFGGEFKFGQSSTNVCILVN